MVEDRLVVTAADGKKSIAFSSSSTAFQVEAGDRMANALLGNVPSSTITVWHMPDDGHTIAPCPAGISAPTRMASPRKLAR